MSLEFVVPPSPGQRTHNIALYGPTNTSKSTAAIKAPDPFLWLNAEGPNALAYPRSQRPDADIREVAVVGESTLDDALLYAGDPKNKIATLVIDSLSESYGIVLRAHAKDPLHPTQPEYGHVSSVFERWLILARDLPVNVIVICHDFTVDDNGVTMHQPFCGTQKESNVSRKLMHVFADVMGYCARIEDDEGNETFKAQLVPANGRHAKNRGGILGKVRDLDVGDWIATLDAADAAAQAKAAKVTTIKEKAA